jgi:serralysin
MKSNIASNNIFASNVQTELAEELADISTLHSILSLANNLPGNSLTSSAKQSDELVLNISSIQSSNAVLPAKSIQANVTEEMLRLNPSIVVSEPAVPSSTESSSPRADAFGSGTATAAVGATGDNNIDGLIQGTKWASNSVTFGFTDSAAEETFLFFTTGWTDYELGYDNIASHSASFESLNGTQRTVVREWLQKSYYDVSNLSPVELTGASDRDATIRIAMSNNPPTAFGYYPAGSVEAGDIWLNRVDYNTPVIGTYAYHTFGHELGHALGLKHGHELGGVSNVAMNSDRDSMEFSIMTYRSYVGDPLSGGYSNEAGGYAQTLMMYDIRAIQQMYGAYFGANSTNSNYTFSTTTGEMFINGVGQGTPYSNRIFRTIWDGNGIDTYDFSNYTTNLSVNLAPGGWSDLDTVGTNQQSYLGDGNYARGHVFNALQYNGDARSLIENATGGTGNDSIVGNDANNTLNGGAGDDTVNGGNGDDYINLGDGNDYVNITSSGNDTFVGGNGNDYIDGLSGNETYYGDAGNDSLYGRSGNDYLSGGADNDTILAGDGNDTADGGSGNDFIDLGAGDDSLNSVGFGNDTFFGGAGNDFIYGYTGDEIYNGDAGNDTLRGYSGNDTLNGGADNDLVEGGSGSDVMDGGIGTDTLNVADLTTAYVINLNTGITNDPLETAINFENINSGSGNDTITSWSGGFGIINTGAGNDYVITTLGQESMDGGSGIDTVDITFWSGDYILDLTTGIANYSEIANNFENVSTGAGNDSLTGSVLDNIMNSGAGNDTVNSGDGNDTIDAGAGNDTVNSGGGNDTVDGGSGNDTVDGGSGNDYINLGDGDDSLNSFASGNDTYVGGNGHDFIWGGAGNETYYGDAGNDTLRGDPGNDSMYGGSGNDLIRTNSGDTDVMDGGVDIDTLDATLLTSNYVINLGTGATNIVGSTATNFENINTGSGNDSVTGSNADNIITSGAGDDSIVGGNGNDSLDGGIGNDLLRDTIGNDTLNGDDGNDNIYAGAGLDSLVGGNGNDYFYIDDIDVIVETALVGSGTDTVVARLSYTLAANVENLILDNGYPAALIGFGNSGNNIITGNSLNNSLTGGDGNDSLSGGVGNDSLRDTLGNDTLNGGDGNDNIYAGSGLDSLIGGNGNDVFYIDDVDAIVETALVGSGTDTVVARLSYTLAANVENLLLDNGAIYLTALIGVGNSGNNTITGNSLNNALTGGAGNDSLSGGVGNDTLRDTLGNDTLNGGDGNDNIYAGVGLDSLIGGNGNDYFYIDDADVVVEAATVGSGTDTVIARISYTLTANVENLSLDNGLLYPAALNGTGNVLNNVIIGNSLSNILTGGGGNDTVSGGAGVDQFVLNNTGIDTISDFTALNEALQVSAAAFGGGLSLGTLALGSFLSTNVVGATSATSSTQRFVFNTVSRGLYFDVDGLNGLASVQIATLTGVAALSNTNISVIA